MKVKAGQRRPDHAASQRRCSAALIPHPRARPQAWVEARKASDFSKFAPFLQEWVDVRRKAVSGRVTSQGQGGAMVCPSVHPSSYPNNTRTHAHKHARARAHTHSLRRAQHLYLQARLIDPSGDPYDVLLDDYEKGMTAERLDAIFEEVSHVDACFALGDGRGDSMRVCCALVHSVVHWCTRGVLLSCLAASSGERC